MSRSTFRETVDICWQKQLRDKYLDEGMPPVPHLDVGRAIVRPVSNRFAKQIILKYEWLGTMGAGTQRSYGLFFGNYCAGVVCYAASGGVPALIKTFRLRHHELVYLARGACVHWAPSHANSRLIAMSLRLEGQRGAKLAVAFSDTDAGEIGTVYQATNWVCVGKTDPWFQWVSPQGKVWSNNSATRRRKRLGVSMNELEQRLIAEGWTKQLANPKHRYVYIIDRKDKALVKRVERMRQPYPKRADEATQ